jgi:hypothetical protein
VERKSDITAPAVSNRQTRPSRGSETHKNTESQNKKPASHEHLQPRYKNKTAKPVIQLPPDAFYEPQQDCGSETTGRTVPWEEREKRPSGKAKTTLGIILESMKSVGDADAVNPVQIVIKETSPSKS